jgi:macrolide transport system ATP-binding/permease protein
LEGQENQLKARLLEMGLFRYDELDKQLGQLSAGQQRKLQIARLIAERANVLILDEPTNHVSFDVLEGMEVALRNFPGAVIAATHDRRFMQNLCADDPRTQIWEVRDGQIIVYLGGYEEYIGSQVVSGQLVR